MELQSGYSALPSSIASGRAALFISGNNHSDDLFTFFTRRLDGLKPSTGYTATFALEIATNVPRGCGGVGGSPGESVFVKAGASTAEPRVTQDSSGALRMTIDKGNQAIGGSNALVLGTIENSRPCTLENLATRPWELKTLSSGSQITIETDANGRVWLLIGTDSGFEGPTSLYYVSFQVDLAAGR